MVMVMMMVMMVMVMVTMTQQYNDGDSSDNMTICDGTAAVTANDDAGSNW